MDKSAKIYIAGHRGLVGSSLVRELSRLGYNNIITRTHEELELTNQIAVADFFKKEKPEYVFLAAAKVGGIKANHDYPADFIYQNIAIQQNIIHQAYLNNTKRLLFLGSSCIYPRNSIQPIKEEYLLSGELEFTNRSYALAKIAGIESCWAYNRQYDTQFLALMPTNLYGPNDNYDLNNSHVIPALIRKMHEAKINAHEKVVIWGTGKPRREFLHVDDLARACAVFMNLPDNNYKKLINSNTAPVVNIGMGEDITISELAELIKVIVGYKGKIVFDTSKPDGTPRKCLDVSKAGEMGWQASITLDQGLRDTYQAYKNNVDKLCLVN